MGSDRGRVGLLPCQRGSIGLFVLLRRRVQKVILHLVNLELLEDRAEQVQSVFVAPFQVSDVNGRQATELKA
jgi:hypothetical protein